jgi:membrane protein YqaA with SNARE-associated domain
MLRDNLLKGILGLTLFLVAMGLLGVFFEEGLTAGTTWVVEQIGFLGLCLILLVTDALVTPFPPDLLLVVIANSHLSEHWIGYVLVLGVVSVVAGMLGWSIGRWLGCRPLARRLFGEFKDERALFIRKHGFWAVVAGSITPLPFSVTCWGAGILGVRFFTVLVAALVSRVPRFVAYYWLLVQSSNFFLGRGLVEP